MKQFMVSLTRKEQMQQSHLKGKTKTGEREENVHCETHRTKRNVPAWQIIYIYIVLQYM